MDKQKKADIIKIILKTVGAAGLLSMAILAPNALQALDMFYSDQEYNRYHKKYYIKNAVRKLKEKGLIEFKDRGGKYFISLTSKGEERLLKYRLKELSVEKPKRWDRKWRVVIFDIKERKRGFRDELRNELAGLGFLKLQNSVWVYPYDCEEIIILLKSYFHLGKEVLYMVVEKLENDKWLKKEFDF